MSTSESGRRFLAMFLVGCTMGAVAISSAVRADSDGSMTDRAIIAEEVRKELRRLIDEEGFMDRVIEQGIESYIEKKRVAATEGKRRKSAEHARKLRPVSPQRDHIYGDPNAPVSLVEYSDFECPFCKRYHPNVKKLIEQNTGKVNWVYRHFPLEFHNPGAQKQAEATECAAELGGNEAFWRYSDLIYQRTTSNGRGFPIDRLVPLAEEIGLDGKTFRGCLDSGRMITRVREDYEDGVKAGITGTPGTIFLNHVSGDVFATAGALPVSSLQTAVDRLLSEQKAKKQ
ncbi:MAG: thioredoxin domain-containing protein [Gammaproteobacteria bacterium]|nr:thioredoxin domain-containing protein [Gammaproteobacteria bacterium]